MAEVTETTPAATPASASSPDAASKRTASTQQNNKHQASGLAFKRHFTQSGVSPYDKLTWERRTAAIIDSKGNVIFEQKDVEVPKDWSMTATNIVASKYLHGQMDTPQRETGVRQLVTGV
jgi:ribonucleoside-diphosphate reductase alpha chain